MKTVVKALLIDSSGKLLILRRSSTHPHYALQPDLPGGEVDDGETEIEAVVREIQEESGLVIAPEALRQVATREREGRKKHRADVLYVGHLGLSAPAITISWEHDRHDWYTREEFLALPRDESWDPYMSFVQERLKTQQI